MLTIKGIDALEVLEPCGNGCPKPVLMMEKLRVDRISMVGGGRHMRLRLRSPRGAFNAIYFSANPESASIAPGDLVDIAFNPQVNEFRGERSVQMNVLDIRPSCSAPCGADDSGFIALRRGTLTPATAEAILPDRTILAIVWRYLAASPAPIHEVPICLCRKIVRWSGVALDLSRLLVCLDIFSDVGLLSIQRRHKHITIRLTPGSGKADLNQSRTMQTLLQAKES